MNPQSSGGRSAADPSPSGSGIDLAAWQQRLDRLSAVLATIADHAGSQARWRCPYKDRHDHCTAAFGCRNQRRLPAHDQRSAPNAPRFRCAGDDKLDYRSAWEDGGGTPATSQER